MALNSHLGFLFKATDQASGVMRRISLGMSQLTHGSKLAQQAMAGVSLSFMGNTLVNFAQQGAGALLSAADASGKFTQQLTAARSVIEGATAKDMDMLGNAAMKLGARYGVGAQQMAAGAKTMGQAGLDTNAILQTMAPNLLFATSAGLSFDSAAGVLIGTLNAFQKDFSEAGSVVDKFANILNSTQASGEDIQSTFAKAASMAGMFGQDIDQTLVLLGLMRQLNIDASSISTSIRESHRRMFTMPTVMNHIKGMNIDLFDDNGKERNWLDIVFEIKDALKGLTPELARAKISAIFGARGIFAYEVATNSQIKTMRNGRKEVLQFREAFDELLKQQQKTGTAKRLADALANTFEGQKQRLNAILGNLKISIGKGFEEAFTPIIQVLNNALDSLNNFMISLGPQGRQAVAVFLMIEVGVVALAGSIMALLGSLALLKMMLPVIAPMLMPVLGITAGVLAVSSALVITYKALQGEAGKAGTFLNQLSESFARVKLFAQGLWQLLTTGRITGLPVLELLKRGNTGVRDSLGTTWQYITRTRAMISGFMDGLASHLQNPVVKEALDSLKESFSGLMDRMGMGSQGLSKLTNSTGDARNVGREWGKWLWFVTYAVINLADALTQTVNLALDLKEFLKPVKDFVVDSGLLRLVGQILLVMGALKALKAGGMFLGSMFMAAERGIASATRFLSAANAVRKYGGAEVLNANGSVAQHMAPGISRQLLNLTGITFAGQAITGVLASMGLTGLAATLGASVTAISASVLGFAGAAAALGVGAGMLLDNIFGLSDGISKWLHDWLHEYPEGLAQKDGGAYVNQVSTRAAPAFLSPAAAVAANTATSIQATQQATAASTNGVNLSKEAIEELSSITGKRGSIVAKWNGQVIAEFLDRHQKNLGATSFNAEDMD